MALQDVVPARERFLKWIVNLEDEEIRWSKIDEAIEDIADRKL